MANFQAFADQILEFERTSRKDRLTHCGLPYPSKRHKSFLRELFPQKMIKIKHFIRQKKIKQELSIKANLALTTFSD